MPTAAKTENIPTRVYRDDIIATKIVNLLVTFGITAAQTRVAQVQRYVNG